MSRPTSCSADLSTPLALIQYCGSDSPGRGVRRRAHVAVAEPADAVEQLHVTEVAGGEDLLDRERGRQQVERAEPLAGPRDLTGDLVAVAQLGREVGGELVADHQPRRRERLDPGEHAS